MTGPSGFFTFSRKKLPTKPDVELVSREGYECCTRAPFSLVDDYVPPSPAIKYFQFLPLPFKENSAIKKVMIVDVKGILTAHITQTLSVDNLQQGLFKLTFQNSRSHDYDIAFSNLSVNHGSSSLFLPQKFFDQSQNKNLICICCDGSHESQKNCQTMSQKLRENRYSGVLMLLFTKPMEGELIFDPEVFGFNASLQINIEGTNVVFAVLKGVHELFDVQKNMISLEHRCVPR